MIITIIVRAIDKMDDGGNDGDGNNHVSNAIEIRIMIVATTKVTIV